MPHRNDMSVWPDIVCQRGCEHHRTRPVWVHVGGKTGYRDLTDIPTRFSRDFTIEVWDTEHTPVDGGPYCPARDAVSETILSHGVWEPAETAVLLCCFEQHPGGLFVDFGSQLGWFSTVALLSNMNVLALDADADCVDLTYRNLVRNAPLLASFGSHLERLGPDTAPFSYDDERVKLPIVAKIDVEGAEEYAIAKLRPLIDEGWVEYILMEVSPVFHDGYGQLAVDLTHQGFRLYDLPPKQSPPIQIRTLTDLVPFEIGPGTHDYVRNNIDGCHQKDVLFVKGGIE